MSDRFIVAGVFANEFCFPVRIGVTADPGDTFTNWRRRYGVFIPVTVYRTDADPDFVARTVSTGVCDFATAVGLLHHLPIDFRYRRLVLVSIRNTGQLGVTLLSGWANAVADATGSTE